MSTPWKTKNWNVSPYNFADEVRSTNIPQKVEIHDTTLREGEQTAGVVFRSEEKLKIAFALCDLGIRHIEVALLTTGEHGPEALKAVAGAGLDATISTMALALNREQIDLAFKCDVSNLYLVHNTSLQWDLPKPAFESLSDKLVDNIVYAKEHGAYVNFFLVDSTRMSWASLSGLMKNAVEQGHADSVTLADSYGVGTPETYEYLVRKIKEVTGVPVEVHCHNSFGLGTSNTLAGYRAGAERLHTSVNGIGMLGFAATEEVVMALKALYNADLELRYEKLYGLCKLVEKLSRTKLTRYKPVSGDYALGYEAIERVKSALGVLLVPYNPEFVGQKINCMCCKTSDISAIEAKLKEFDISATQDQKEFMLTKVKELATEERRAVTDNEFKDIVKLSRKIGL